MPETGGKIMEQAAHRYNIGLVVGDIESVFSSHVAEGAMRAAEQTDDNLFLFPANYLNGSKSGKYEYENNILFSYAKSRSLDMVLLCLDDVTRSCTAEQRLNFLKGFSRTPVMLIASQEKGYPSVSFDSGAGLREGLSYLITAKRCRQIGLAVTQLSSPDTQRLLEIFRSVLREHGIAPDSGLLAESGAGEGRQSLQDIDRMLDANPDLDAVVCAGGSAAKNVYGALRRRHRVIGQDIYVLGCDDISGASQMLPPLAAVRADASQLGYNAVFACREQLRRNGGGKTLPKPVTVTISTKFILRESASGTYADSADEFRRQALWNQSRLKEILSMNHHLNVVSKDMLMFDGQGGLDYARFLRAFSLDSVTCCYLYLFGEAGIYGPGCNWDLPHHLYLRGYRIGDETRTPPPGEQLIPVSRMFRNRFLPEERKTFVLIDIFSCMSQYGVLMCDIPHRYFNYIERICCQIGIAMKLTCLVASQQRLLGEKEEMLRSLERQNLILGKISTKDDLTGILNRRGFITKVDAMLCDPQNIGQKAALLYADLNYLKQINDTFNHTEGNFALSCCARVLEESVGWKGVAGRLGGDEFAVCALISHPGGGKELGQRIGRSLEALNAHSNKPYEITLSIGIIEFEISRNTQLRTLIKQSDRLMYEAKKKKKPFLTHGAQKDGTPAPPAGNMAL